MATKVQRPAPTPLPSFTDNEPRVSDTITDSISSPGPQLQSRQDNSFQKQELQHALETIALYEQQVNGLLDSLRQADANWEKAEQVRHIVAVAR